ncbi:hypothetical protein HYV85_04460 [Candidatus Woesearchaeota archaeon]|nr:hypothetical protein [Candidatus Woesearchaeota archaeon]
MGTALGTSLSDIVGEGKNSAISFGDGELNGGMTPLVEIVLKDERVVRIPLNKKGRRYELEANGQTLMVYPKRQMVQVVGNAGEILSQQKYSNPAKK